MAIPIHNVAGELVAYAGRSVDSSEPKYLFPTGFRKSAELFNLHRVNSNPSQALIVIEGFFDCVRVHQAGFPNVVALMGCAMSREQTKLLCALCSRAVLFLDGDSAGRRALSAILSTLAARGLEVRKVCLPDGWQPDTMSTHHVQRSLGNSTECKYTKRRRAPKGPPPDLRSVPARGSLFHTLRAVQFQDRGNLNLPDALLDRGLLFAFERHLVFAAVQFALNLHVRAFLERGGEVGQ
jgi:hypothetical protein